MSSGRFSAKTDFSRYDTTVRDSVTFVTGTNQLVLQVKTPVHSIPVVATMSAPVAFRIVSNLARGCKYNRDQRRRSAIIREPRADRSGLCSARRPISPIPIATKAWRARASFVLASADGCTTAVTTRPGMGFWKRRLSHRAAARLAQRQLPGSKDPCPSSPWMRRTRCGTAFTPAQATYQASSTCHQACARARRRREGPAAQQPRESQGQEWRTSAAQLLG